MPAVVAWLCARSGSVCREAAAGLNKQCWHPWTMLQSATRFVLPLAIQPDAE